MRESAEQDQSEISETDQASASPSTNCSVPTPVGVKAEVPKTNFFFFTMNNVTLTVYH